MRHRHHRPRPHGRTAYNTVTGLFTSVDPVRAGNSTAYVYPQDPVNSYDLTGQWRVHWKSVGKFLWKHKWDIALTATLFVPGLGEAAWAARGAVEAYEVAESAASAGLARQLAIEAQQSEKGIEMARGSKIKDVNRLDKKYGGHRDGWTKRSSSSHQFRGSSLNMQTHWYEHDSGLRVEYKQKFQY
jgi:hypothetical protein